MALPALAGIGLLVSAIVSALVSFFSWIIQFFTRRFAIVATAIVVIGSMTTAFLMAIKALIDGIVATTPPYFSIAAGWVIPDNAPLCFAAIASAHTLRFIYLWQLRILEYKIQGQLMDFIFITGKLGQGKTLAAIDRIKRRIEKGCPVATNCDIYLHRMFNRDTDKPRVIRLPDKPTYDDLNALGRAYPDRLGYREELNGLIVLDECGDWFNSRNWQDKSRAGINTWFRHARKLGWDVYLIVQDISLIDSQARSSLAASIAKCKRLDKVAIPFITTFSRLFSEKGIRPAKLHMARVTDEDGLLLDRWAYRGTHLYNAYNTKQIFMTDYEHGTYCLLTPWHLYGRYKVPMNWSNIMRLTHIYLKRFSRPMLAVASSFFTALLMTFFFKTDTPKALATAGTAEPSKLLHQTQNLEPVDVETRFNGWRFDGSQQINSNFTYYFLDSQGNRYTNKMRSMQGYEFIEHGFCTVELYDPKTEQSIVLHCDRQHSPPINTAPSNTLAQAL